MPHRMHSASSRSLLYQEAFKWAQPMEWEDMNDLRSAVMRCVNRPGAEDEDGVPGGRSITYEIPMPDWTIRALLGEGKDGE